MRRHIFKQLKHWKQNKKRKPLILMGARQVGKTYILRVFAKAEYDNVVYLNFEDEPKFKHLFAQSLKPEQLIRVIEIECDVKIRPASTLIIFDEVQAAPATMWVPCLKWWQSMLILQI